MPIKMENVFDYAEHCQINNKQIIF